jgi:hypothetical protein
VQLDNFLKGRNLGRTGNNLVKALTGKETIAEIQKLPGCIAEAFSHHVVPTLSTPVDFHTLTLVGSALVKTSQSLRNRDRREECGVCHE